MKQKFKRRRFPVVDRAMQYKFLMLILSYGMIIVIFLGLMLFVPDVLALSNEDLSIEVRSAAAERVLALHSRAWPAIIAVICLISLHSFRVFHRVIGPLYRLRWAFSKIIKGSLNFRVKLRKKDYLHREEEMINEMIDVFARNWGSIQDIGMDALRSLEDLERSVTDMDSWEEAHQELLRTQRQRLESLVEKTRYFRLTAEEEEKQETAAP